MSDKELVTNAISRYMDLLRIQKAQDREKEIVNQLRQWKAALESMGVTVENLQID